MSIEIVESNYRVSRKAPGELVKNFPELWKKLSRQRFAWLHIPWLAIIFAILFFVFLPFAIIFLALWIWQRKKPILLVCKIVELFICLYFSLLLLSNSIKLINIFPGGPFALIGVFGAIFLSYEASARSWHYLFNYMVLTSHEFSKIATSNNWVLENTNFYKGTKTPIYIALTGVILILILTVILLLVLKMVLSGQS